MLNGGHFYLNKYINIKKQNISDIPRPRPLCFNTQRRQVENNARSPEAHYGETYQREMSVERKMRLKHGLLEVVNSERVSDYIINALHKSISHTDS